MRKGSKLLHIVPINKDKMRIDLVEISEDCTIDEMLVHWKEPKKFVYTMDTDNQFHFGAQAVVFWYENKDTGHPAFVAWERVHGPMLMGLWVGSCSQGLMNDADANSLCEWFANSQERWQELYHDGRQRLQN